MRFKTFFESFQNKVVVMDIDDTLFTTDARVIIYKPDGKVIKLTSDQFKTYQRHPDDKMDLSQFHDPDLFIKTAKPTKYIKIAQNISKARRDGRSNTNLYIITARDPSIEKALTQKLASLGITHDGLFSTVETGAPTIAEGKKQILEKIRSMHKGRVEFFDDNEKNISLAKQIPGIRVRQVSKESLDKLAESWKDDDDMDNSPDWDSLYINHFSGIREAARKLGINLETARLINSKRPSLKDIKDVKDGPKYHQWYSVGTAWLDWMQAEMPQWLAPYTYAVVLDETNMMKVNSKASIKKFREKYILHPMRPKDIAIDWINLYKSHIDIIEFSPYLGHVGGIEDLWYDSIDMDSGAIINKRCIKKIIKLYDGTDDFKDMGIKI